MKLRLPVSLLIVLGTMVAEPVQSADMTISSDSTINQDVEGFLRVSNGVSLIIDGSQSPVLITGLTSLPYASTGTGKLTASNTTFAGGILTGSSTSRTEIFSTLDLKDCTVQGSVTLIGSAKGLASSGEWNSTSLTMTGGRYEASYTELKYNARVVFSGVGHSEDAPAGNMKLSSSTGGITLLEGSDLKLGELSDSSRSGGWVYMEDSAITANKVYLNADVDSKDVVFRMDHSRLNVIQDVFLMRSRNAEILDSVLVVQKHIDLYSGTYLFKNSTVESKEGYFRICDPGALAVVEDTSLKMTSSLSVMDGATLTVKGKSQVELTSGSLSVQSEGNQKSVLNLLGSDAVMTVANVISMNNTNTAQAELNIEGGAFVSKGKFSTQTMLINLTNRGYIQADTINLGTSTTLNMEEGTSLTSRGSLIVSASSEGKGNISVSGAVLKSSEDSLKLLNINEENCFLSETTLMGKNIFMSGMRDKDVVFSSVYMSTTGGVFELEGGARIVLNGKTTASFDSTYLHGRSFLTVEEGAQVSLGALFIGPDVETDGWPRYGRLIIEGNREVTSGQSNIIYGPAYDDPNGPSPDLKSALIIREGGLLTMGSVTDPAADDVSLHVGGGGTTLTVTEGSFIETDGLMSIDQGAAVTMDKSASTRISGLMLADAGTNLLLKNSTGISLGNITVGNGAVLDVQEMVLDNGHVTLQSGGTAYLAVTTGMMDDGGILSLASSSCLASADMLTTEDGGRVGTSISNTEEGAPSWTITLDDLRSSLNLVFGEHDVSAYAYRIYGKVIVSNVAIKPGEKIEAGPGAIVDMGEHPLEGELALAGGNIDVSRTGTELKDDKITGSAGDLVTSSGQTLYLDRTQEVGYALSGCDSGCGAAMVIGSASQADPGAEAPVIVLKGDHYNSDAISVVQGTVMIHEQSTVGSGNDGAVLTLGDKENGTQATLVNNGVVNNALTVNEGSLLKGTGVFVQKVALDAHTNLIVGNSPGFQNYKNGLDLNGAKVEFSLDGREAATLTNKGEGTYSNILVEGGPSVWTGEQNFVLSIGRGLLQGDSVQFNLDIIRFANPDLVNMDGSTISSELTGLTELVDPASIRIDWNADHTSLMVTGSLNAQKVQEILTPDSARIANTMWSSTRSVAHFAGAALSRLDSPRGGASNYWVSGLGDFSHVSGSASVSGFDYNGGGYSVGADHSFSRSFTAGLAFGQTFGTNKAKDGGYASTDQNGIMGGVYTRFQNEISKTSSWGLDTYVAYGNVENKTHMALEGAPDLYSGKWMDDVVSLGLKAHWEIKLDSVNTLTPFVGIDYLHGAQKDVSLYSRDGYERFYNGRMQTWSVPVGVNYRTSLSLGGQQYLIPEVTVSYVGDISRQNPVVTRDILGQRVSTEGVNTGRNAFRGSAGMTWVITQNWNFGVRYDLECRSSMTNQAVNGTVSYSF